MIKINLKDYALKNSLREKRLERGLSQGELAKALGCSRNTVSTIERKNVSVGLALAIEICRFFGCKFQEMFRLEKKE